MVLSTKSSALSLKAFTTEDIQQKTKNYKVIFDLRARTTAKNKIAELFFSDGSYSLEVHPRNE